MSEPYYVAKDLPKFEEIGEEAPQLAKKFFDYYHAVLAEGELTAREKALVALAVAHTRYSAPTVLTRIPRRAWRRGPI